MPNYEQSGRLYQNMMSMSTAAFQEAIIFAHLQYHINPKKGAGIDLVDIGGEGIDYNQLGYPVGIDRDQRTLLLPISVGDCRSLWQTLLAPMSPYLTPDDFASLEVKALRGKCVFTSVLYTEQRIIYDPNTGKVSLQVI